MPHANSLVGRLKDALHRLRGTLPDGIARFALDPSEIPEEEKRLSDVHRFFYGNDGPLVHKWRNYLAVYDRYLSQVRGGEVRLLEIGVSRGGSLRLWRTYLGAQAVIFGVDIDPACARFDGQDGQVRIGSQADPAFLRAVVAEMGGVDVVIDDGSHVASHQRASFDALFPLLATPGIYICEDLHTAYWPGEFEGGYRRRSSFIEVAKRIVDDMHHDFHRRPPGLADAHRLIGGIHFHNSIVVIEKALQPPPASLMVGPAEPR